MEDLGRTAVLVLVQIFMLVGLFGLFVPAFPGILVMWLAALAYAIFSGWGGGWGIACFVLMTLLMIGGEVADNLLMGMGARRGGASWWSIAAALLAGLVGTLVFPPIGGLIAAPLVVLLLEYRRQGEWEAAKKALKGLATGWSLSFALRFGIGLGILLLWWLWIFLR